MEEKSNKYIVIWLLTGALLVASMVLVGGITRLTQSGLSIVEWKFIIGAVPPLSEQEWRVTFEKYQQFPEYQKLNLHYNLNDFKSIFWWEFSHRLLGRVIGMVFLVPFLYFLMKGKLNKRLVLRLIFVFALGGFQGFLGWYMVESGLVNNPHVSHYRLAAHLVTAFILFVYILNLAFNIGWPSKSNVRINYYQSILKLLLLFIAIQILYGAFVAGLNAGLFYSTFPTMSGEWLPSIILKNLVNTGWISLIDTVAGVQYIHRWLGTGLWIIVVLMGVVFVPSLTDKQRNGYWFLLSSLSVQVLLGIYTLLHFVPLAIAVMHQFGALLVLASWVYANHTTKLAVSIS